MAGSATLDTLFSELCLHWAAEPIIRQRSGTTLADCIENGAKLRKLAGWHGLKNTWDSGDV